MVLNKFLYLGILVAFLISLSTFFHPIHPDEHIFQQVSQQLQQGSILYHDAVDHKPPGIYWVWYLVSSFWYLVFKVKLSAESLTLAVRVVTLAANLTTSYFIYLICTLSKFKYKQPPRLSGFTLRETGLIAALSYLLFLTFYQGQYAITEPFMAMWLVMGSYLVFKTTADDLTPNPSPNRRGALLLLLGEGYRMRSKSLLFLSGICFGLALFFKQPAVVNIMAVYIFTVLIQIPNNKSQISNTSKIQISNLLFDYLLFTLGILFIWLPVIFYFHTQQALPDFWYAVVTFNLTQYPPMWVETFSQLPAILWPILVLGILYQIISAKYVIPANAGIYDRGLKPNLRFRFHTLTHPKTWIPEFSGITTRALIAIKQYNNKAIKQLQLPITNYQLLTILFILLPLPIILTRPYHHYWIQVLPFLVLYTTRVRS